MAVLEELEHDTGAEKPPRCATTVVGTIELFMHLEGVVDIEQERARLQKQQDELQEQIQSVDAVLHNADFLSKAPEEVVQQKMDRAEELRAQLQVIIQNLADLE
jgi:valyl-tRNA synthetase